jgi:hypothetical protein
LSTPIVNLNWGDLEPADTEAAQAAVDTARQKVQTKQAAYQGVKDQALRSGYGVKLNWNDLIPDSKVQPGVKLNWSDLSPEPPPTPVTTPIAGAPGKGGANNYGIDTRVGGTGIVAPNGQAQAAQTIDTMLNTPGPGETAPPQQTDVQSLLAQLAAKNPEGVGHIPPSPAEPLLRLSVTQKADQPVTPELAGETVSPERLAQFAKNGYAGLESVPAIDIQQALAAGTITKEQAVQQLHDRTEQMLAAKYNIPPEELKGAITSMGDPEKVLANLKAYTDEPTTNGHYLFALPGGVPLALEGMRRIDAYAKMSPNEKEGEAWRIAQERPLSDREKTALGYHTPEHQAVTVTAAVLNRFLSGGGKDVYEAISGVGKALGIDAITKFGQGGQETAKAFGNLYGEPGTVGNLAETAGHLAPEIAGSQALPEAKIAHALYWFTIGSGTALGRGATPKQATSQGAQMVAMLGLGKLAGPLAEESDSIVEGLTKLVARGGQGAVIGYGLARASGADDQQAREQAILFGAMHAIGGGGKVPERPMEGILNATPIPEAAPALAAQMEALTEGRGTRKAVMVTPGETAPEVPKGFVTTPTPTGDFIHDPKVISVDAVTKAAEDGTFHELLGIKEPKSAENLHAAVVARDAKGNELQTALTSEATVEAQVKEFKAQYPEATITVEHPAKVVLERLQSQEEGGQANATIEGKQQGGGEGKLQGIRGGEDLRAHEGEVRGEAGQRPTGGGGAEGGGQVEQGQVAAARERLKARSETQPPPEAPLPTERTMMVQGESVTANLTPETAAKFDAINARTKQRRANTQEQLDAGTLNGQEAAARNRADAMTAAAEKRKLHPDFATAVEQGNAAKRERTNYIGKQVEAGGQVGEVVGNPFGRVKVKFEDGTTKNFAPTEVKAAVKATPLPTERQFKADQALQKRVEESAARGEVATGPPERTPAQQAVADARLKAKGFPEPPTAAKVEPIPTTGETYKQQLRDAKAAKIEARKTKLASAPEPAKASPETAYDASLGEFRAASQEFRKAQEAYRKVAAGSAGRVVLRPQE